MCASPTFVQTRTSGSAIPIRSRISPGVVHAELDDGHLGTVRKLGQRQRQADVVVEIAAIPEHAIARGQQIRRDFLGGGLAGAAGDGNHGGAATRRRISPGETAAEPPACPPTSMTAVPGATSTGARHENSRRRRVPAPASVVVTVEAIALDRDEQRARADGPAVDGN